MKEEEKLAVAKKMNEEKKEFKLLDLTNHASQVLRKFFRQEDGDKTNYTATDLYEVLEMSEKKLKEDIKLAVQGLLQEIEEDIAYWKKVMKEYEEKELNAKTEEEKKEYDEYWKIAEQVHRVLNTRIKNLIKKWFPDEENE